MMRGWQTVGFLRWPLSIGLRIIPQQRKLSLKLGFEIIVVLRIRAWPTHGPRLKFSNDIRFKHVLWWSNYSRLSLWFQVNHIILFRGCIAYPTRCWGNVHCMHKHTKSQLLLSKVEVSQVQNSTYWVDSSSLVTFKLASHLSGYLRGGLQRPHTLSSVSTNCWARIEHQTLTSISCPHRKFAM